MKSVFVVATPLQMLNAIEANHSLGLRGITLVIILSEPFPKHVFYPLLSFADWERIIYMSVSHRYDPIDLSFAGEAFSNGINEYLKELKQFSRRQKFESLVRSLGHVDSLVLGNYLEGFMRHLGNAVNPRRLYLIDDGTDILRINEMRSDLRSSPVESHPTLARKFKNLIMNRFVNWNNRQADSVTFFSSYDLLVRDGDILIKNNYEFFRSRMTNCSPSDEVYFLGQPLVEDGYLSQERYNAYLKKIERTTTERV